MPEPTAVTDLTNHFLIAMPGMQDPLFSGSVVYVCEHGERGTLGLIVNKPSDITLKDLFDKVELPLERADLLAEPVFIGGPVQMERGFVLHEPTFGEQPPPEEPVYGATLRVPGGLEMTTSKDVLEALSSGSGPRKLLVTLGYSAWGEGQLEAELADNAWLTVAADATLVFDTAPDRRYAAALALLGLQAWMIAPDAGHA